MALSRETYLDQLTFRAFHRPFFVEMFGPLVGLEDEWRAQGASPGELDLTAFGFDFVRVHHVWANTGLAGGFEAKVIEDTPEHVISQDAYGRRTRLCKGKATIPLPLDHPVRDWETWQRFKPYYEFSEARFAPDWAAAARQARAEGVLVVVSVPGGFDEPRQLLGEAEVCLACYEQPELIQDILTTIADTAERVLARVCQEVQVDVLSIHEDLAGKSGPLFGPAQVKRFMAPHYRRAWDLVRAHGARLFQVDCDGNLNAIIPALLDTGVNCVFPMEPAAGMDIVATRRLYGQRLALMGGIDKHALRQGRAAIDRELAAKLVPLRGEAGLVFGLDHRIPNGTPLADYRYYVRRTRELLGLPLTPPPGWQRMAF